MTETLQFESINTLSSLSSFRVVVLKGTVTQHSTSTKHLVDVDLSGNVNFGLVVLCTWSGRRRRSELSTPFATSKNPLKIVLKMLGLYFYTFKIGHKSCNTLSIRNKLTLKKEFLHPMRMRYHCTTESTEGIDCRQAIYLFRRSGSNRK